jgi:phosphatidylinositol dimannoside acyltransferase
VKPRARRGQRPRPAGTSTRGLEAPHRRRGSAPRAIERAGVLGYRAGEWLIGHAPQGLARFLIARASQASYLAWPQRRRWSNDNFAHVLGTGPDDPRVRSLALAAYSTYARYLVELMRLPQMSVEQVASVVEAEGVDAVVHAWRGSGRGLIVSAGHVGNNEVVAGGLAGMGLPVAAVADDSTFPELFEHLRERRERWHLKLVPWRNLREIYGVLRRAEILALLIDWGYRDDGIPVRFFGAWTTLPGGPAILSAKTGAPILPAAARRLSPGRFRLTPGTLVTVASTEPAELLRATQELADQLEDTIRAAPEQWYSFKPMWPSTADEAADLAHRAHLMAANLPDPGPSRSRRPSRAEVPIAEAGTS